jgi:hypothetical protein
MPSWPHRRHRNTPPCRDLPGGLNQWTSLEEHRAQVPTDGGRTPIAEFIPLWVTAGAVTGGAS